MSQKSWRKIRIHRDTQTLASREKFLIEKQLWIAKNGNSPLFSTYSYGINKMIKDVGIRSALYCLRTGQNQKARKEARSLGLANPKAAVAYVGSFLPMPKWAWHLPRGRWDRDRWI